MRTVQECFYGKLYLEFQINTLRAILLLLELTEPPFTSACHAVGTCTDFGFRDMYGRIVGVQVPVGRGASWFLFIACLELVVSFYLSPRAKSWE